MARQKGALKYTGTIGDIRHFKIKGQKGYFAGLIGGPTKEQVMTDDAFQRTRENMSEFGGCAKAGKSIRVALAPLLKHMADSKLTGRLTAIMKKINLEDGSEARGRRAILISQVSKHLVGLNFNKDVSFDSIFRVQKTLTNNDERNAATLNVPAFDPSNYVLVPSGATHMRLINAVASISDYHFDKIDGTYQPKEADLNQLMGIQYSDYIPTKEVTTDLTLTATLPGSPVLTPDVSVLSCVGIEFYQQVGPNYYLLSAGNCFKIERVF